MELNKKDKGKCGIYKIINKVNNKVYVGKARDIYKRIRGHIYALRKKSKDENRYLINAWYKYGESNFEYQIIEELELNEELLRKREDYWIVELKAIDKNFGYNLRRDSSTGVIVSEDTRKLKSKIFSGENNPNYGHKWTLKQREKMSIRLKSEFTSGSRKISKESAIKGITNKKELWLKNPLLKEKMKDKVSKKRTQFVFYQCDKNSGEIIKIWNSVREILIANPNWKRHNIYAACSGEKPSMYGYVWKKILKDDIVQQ